MRKIATLAVFLAAIFFLGCMRHAGRNIRQISLLKSSVTADGSTRTDSLVFRREGLVVRQSRISEHVNSSAPIEISSGRISTDTFERLVRTIEKNDFFAKNNGRSDSGADAGSISIIALSEEGPKSIENADENDPQVKSIITAIETEAVRIEWKTEGSD
jgi:hypothetical protein